MTDDITRMMDYRRIVDSDDAERAQFSPELLRIARRDAQLSRSEVATIVGASQRSVDGWERAEVRPTATRLARVERLIASCVGSAAEAT